MKTIKLSTIKSYRNEREAANAKGDCVVRAFAVFFDIEYSTAREWLNKFNNGRDSVRGTFTFALESALEAYAETRGIAITKVQLSRRTRVSSVVETEEKALILAARHATACINGVHYGNLDQHEADNKMYRDDANQFVKSYWTMKITDINKYLSGNVC